LKKKSSITVFFFLHAPQSPGKEDVEESVDLILSDEKGVKEGAILEKGMRKVLGLLTWRKQGASVLPLGWTAGDDGGPRAAASCSCVSDRYGRPLHELDARPRPEAAQGSEEAVSKSGHRCVVVVARRPSAVARTEEVGRRQAAGREAPEWRFRSGGDGKRIGNGVPGDVRLSPTTRPSARR